MTFQRQLILLVTGLIVAAVLATSGILAWHTRSAMLDKATSDGEMVVGVLARSAALTTGLPREAEALVAEQVLAQALLTAQLVAVADTAKLTPRQLADRLRSVADASVIEDISVSDNRGRGIIHTTPGPDPVLGAEEDGPGTVGDLLRRSGASVDQPMRRRDGDGKPVKSVAVSGVDRPRIVRVTVDAARLSDLAGRLGLERLVDSALGGGGIEAVWLLNTDLRTVAHGARLPNGEDAPLLESAEVETLRTALADRAARSVLLPRKVAVAAPVMDGQTVTGAVLVRLGTAHAGHAARVQVMTGILAAILLGTLGWFAAKAFARRQMAPVNRLLEAAAAVEAGRFIPFVLDDAAARTDELGELARVFRTMAREAEAREERLDAALQVTSAELEDTREKLRAAQEHMEHDGRIAQEMQLSLLPRAFPAYEDHQVFGALAPALGVAGDFFDVFDLDERRLALVMGDVAGHGIAAAAFMTVTRTILQEVAALSPSPGAVLTTLNGRLCDQNPLGMVVSLFYGVYDRVTGELRYANADHIIACRITAGGILDRLPMGASPGLGSVAGQLYGEDRIRLEPEDTLILHTDGLVKARNPSGEPFGEERLLASLNTGAMAADVQVSRIFDTVAAFTDGTPLSDDVSCMVLHRLAVPEVVDGAPLADTEV